jgi:HAD superfamily hydrolase (TIGR01509 family)
MSDLASVLAATRLILLDFDGPTCHLFAGYPAPVVASDLQDYLHDLGVAVPNELASTADPLELYRSAITQCPALADDIEGWLTAAETRAARHAEPTPGVSNMLLAAHRTGRPVAVVSNNSGPAIRAYLAQHELARYVACVRGRAAGQPDRMKPDPWSVLHTAHAQHVPTSACVLVGDSVADIVAATTAGAVSIGYANKPGKVTRLYQAGAATVISDMHSLAAAIDTAGSLAVRGDRG